MAKVNFEIVTREENYEKFNSRKRCTILLPVCYTCKTTIDPQQLYRNIDVYMCVNCFSDHCFKCIKN